MHFKAFDPKNCLCYRKFNNKSFWNKRTKARLGQDFSVKEENHFFENSTPLSRFKIAKILKPAWQTVFAKTLKSHFGGFFRGHKELRGSAVLKLRNHHVQERSKIARLPGRPRLVARFPENLFISRKSTRNQAEYSHQTATLSPPLPACLKPPRFSHEATGKGEIT